MRTKLALLLICVFACLWSPPVGAVAGIGPVLTVAHGSTASLPSSGLTFWVNGRTGLTFSTTVTWADQSTGGHGNFVAGGASRPTSGTINGHTAATFPSTGILQPSPGNNLNLYLGGSTPFPWTVASVFQTTVGNGDEATTFPQFAPMIFGAGQPSTSEQIGMGAQKNTTTTTNLDVYALQWDSAQRSAIKVSSALVANPHYAIAIYDGTNLSISVDGGAAVTSAASANTIASSSAVRIAGSGNSVAQQWTGTVGEIAVWSRALTSPEQAQVGTFFTANWGTLGP